MIERPRAVYYCRVSTDDENQATSIVNQKEESIKAMEDNHWQLMDGYVDEGRSGTTTKRREEYKRLLQDMESDKFDIIVIKSQDRLMRNTKEWYFFIDKLVQHNKRLYFYLERKFYSPDDALITGIKAILAEDYSRNLSKNINHAHRKRQETGSNVVITSKTWGFDKVNKQVVMNDKEAEMVRFIYEMAAQNNGSRTIAKMLLGQGYYNHQGNQIAEQTVRRIIRNPLYKGTAVMNILHKNFETKRTERNSKDKWIYHDHIVPAIVSEELWNKANKLMDARSNVLITNDFKTKIIGSKKNSNPLTSKIVCGLCGSTFWRSTSVAGKTNKVYWSCKEYVQRGRKTKNNRSPKGKTESKYEVTNAGCDNIHLKEEDLDSLIYELSQKIYTKSKENIYSAASAILKQVISDASEIEQQEKALASELEKLKSSREILLDKYLDHKIEDDIYHTKDTKLKKSIAELEDACNELLAKKNAVSEKKDRMKELENEIKMITDYDMSVANIKRHIEKIVVYPDYMIVHFDIFGEVKIEVEKVNYRKKKYHICL